MPILSSSAAHTFRIPTAGSKVTCGSDEFRYIYLNFFSYFQPHYIRILFWAFFSQIGCSLCLQTSLHVSQPCKTPGSVLMYCVGSIWWYQFSDRTVSRDSRKYCDYNFMLNFVSVFVANNFFVQYVYLLLTYKLDGRISIPGRVLLHFKSILRHNVSEAHPVSCPANTD